MRILGIDPGYAIVGYGVIDYGGTRFRTVEYGAICTPAGEDFEVRLRQIYQEMTALIAKNQPEAMSVEKLYFGGNKTTGIDVAQARGVILLTAALAGVPVYEYTPMQVKQAVVGYGKAEKHQVMAMIQRMLSLPEIPRPDDTADALAIAVCHAHCAGSSLNNLLQKVQKVQKVQKAGAGR